MNKELEELKKIEEIKKEFTDILVEFGKVVEDVAIAGVRNPVGFKPTHLWKPAYDRAIERLLETIPSHDEIKREAEYNVLIDFRDFVKNGLDHNRINYDDFNGEFELFMARNYADRRFADVAKTIKKVAKGLTQSKEGGE